MSMETISPANRRPSPLFDLEPSDFLGILAVFDEGVIITDMEGRIVFFNETQAKIDGIEPAAALKKKVGEIYDITDSDSMIMRVLKTGRPIINHTFFYRTRFGKVANTIHSVFPIYKGASQLGVICFVKDYNMLERAVFQTSPGGQKKTGGGSARFEFDDVIGNTHELRQAVKTAQMAASSPSPIMLMGETGSGKEVFAQSIHNSGDRRQQPYVAINCAAIPENLLEGTLFGTTRGAFTGAIDKAGLFEKANGGTLFLDEINSMPLGLQAKLLRVLQEKKVRRVGSLEESPINLKVVSSLNKPPHISIEKGTLRNDLYYRLGVVFIHIPPLRERREDIPELTAHFIGKFNTELGKRVEAVSTSMLYFFQEYHWPGNVRELEHVIEGGMNLVDRDTILSERHVAHHFEEKPELPFNPARPIRPISPIPSTSGRLAGNLPVTYVAPAQATPRPSGGGLVEISKNQEKRIIFDALTTARGNVTQAANTLGISRQRMSYKMRKYGLDRKDFS